MRNVPRRSPVNRLEKRSAFSLPEMLAVIAVIAVLLALLLPMLRVARESARRVTCAAHLAECGKAFVSYANANGGYVPRGFVDMDLNKPPWTALIAKELGLRTPFAWSDVAELKPLHCPSHPTPGPASHFVVNAVNSTRGDGDGPAGLTRLTSLRGAASLVWLLETPPETGRQSYFPFDDIFMEEARFVSEPEHLVGGRRCRLGTRNHGNNRSNVLFADGHVALMDNAALRIEDFMPRGR